MVNAQGADALLVITTRKTLFQFGFAHGFPERCFPQKTVINCCTRENGFSIHGVPGSVPENGLGFLTILRFVLDWISMMGRGAHKNFGADSSELTHALPAARSTQPGHAKYQEITPEYFPQVSIVSPPAR